MQSDDHKPRRDSDFLSGTSFVLEPGGAYYYFNSDPPAGLGLGARFDVPLWRGLGLAAGYQFVRCNNIYLPIDTHHAYGSVVYRFDDFRYANPFIEAGAGYFAADYRGQNREPLQDIALHLGGGVDFTYHRLIIGAFLRYHIYLLSGLTNFPASLAAGLRVGFRIFE
jgi:hypothetical protein